MFITVSTLYRPIDQLLSRQSRSGRQLGQPVGEPMRVAAKIQLGLGAGFRGPRAASSASRSQNNLLRATRRSYWVFFAAVLGYAASYYARGYLAGSVVSGSSRC